MENDGVAVIEKESTDQRIATCQKLIESLLKKNSQLDKKNQ